jgi:hypothetical protein
MSFVVRVVVRGPEGQRATETQIDRVKYLRELVGLQTDLVKHRAAEVKLVLLYFGIPAAVFTLFKLAIALTK